MFKYIYVDFDSTLNDLDSRWVEEINRLTGSNHSVLDISSWDWFFKANDKVIARQALDNIYLKTKQLIGATGFLKQLSYFGRVIILTATEQTDREFLDKKDFHIQKMFGLDYPVIHKVDKFLLAKPNTILIDDKASGVIDFVNKGGYGIVYSKNNTHLYNKTNFEHERFSRINNYRNIITKVRELSESIL